MEAVREGELHPLQNPYILSCIMEDFSLSDLKSCRQVCKTWALESSKKMLPITKVSIRLRSKSKDLDSFLYLVGLEESMWMESPVTSVYRMRSGSADTPHFWELCGPLIRHLSLKDVTFESVDVFLRVICEASPNLEQLYLVSLSFTDKTAARKPHLFSNTSLQTFACDGTSVLRLKEHGVQILNHFPSLQDLKVPWGKTPSKGGAELFQSLASIRRSNPAVLNLKKVDIQFDQVKESQSLLPALVGSGLQLEGIIVRFGYLDTDPDSNIEKQTEVTQALVEAHAASLLELSIVTHFFQTFIHEAIIQRPNNGNLPLLEKLYLTTMRRMRILRLFPNLTELDVGIPELEDVDLLEDMDIKLKVTKLTLTIPKTKDLRHFAHCFPNVEELKVTLLTPNTFPLVCELWPKLRSLWCNLGSLGDAEITGYDVEDVARINREGAASTWRPITVRKANVTSFTKLESFVWTDCAMKPDHCAAVAGVLELPRLKNLVVRLHQKNWVGSGVWKEALNRFTNKMPPLPTTDLSDLVWF